MSSISTTTYNKTVLNNGLRIVTEKIPGVRSISIGIWINVGSRDETKMENGISHFIEHMLFKGTRERSAKEIAFSLESLGGGLNAFTSKEETCYHALVLDEHLDQAVDVLSDILINSTLSPTNIGREKSVVVEEIREIDETPADHIHELFSQNFWRGQPLGWPIMGAAENVRSFNRNTLKCFMKKNYCARRTVVTGAGNISHRKLVNLIKVKFHIPPGTERPAANMQIPVGFSSEFHRNGSKQTHLCIGFPGVRYGSRLRIPLLVLHNYLGGGMSSVLFQKIREEKGMAYTVFTFPDFYRDCGVFGAYLAIDKKHLHEAVEIMLKEFRKLKEDKFSRSKLDKIKEQFRGSLILGMESTSGRMNRLGRQEILTGTYLSLQDSIKLVNSVTSNDIIEVARRIFDPSSITITSLGSARKGDLNKVNWSLL